MKCVRYVIQRVEDVDRRPNMTYWLSVCFYALRSKDASRHSSRSSRFTTNRAYLWQQCRFQNWSFNISCFKPRGNLCLFLFSSVLLSLLQFFLRFILNLFLFLAHVSLIRPQLFPSFFLPLFLPSFFMSFPSHLQPFEFCFRFYFVSLPPLPLFIISSCPFSRLSFVLVICIRKL
jgi:hypothetical protein